MDTTCTFAGMLSVIADAQADLFCAPPGAALVLTFKLPQELEESIVMLRSPYVTATVVLGFINRHVDHS